MNKLPLLSFVFTAVLSACTLAPNYQRPDAPVAASYPVDAGTAAADAAADLGWRDFFSDAQLQQLIETALANNRDLRVAVLNIEAARAQYRIQRAELFPAINASGSETVQRTPDALLASPGAPNVTRGYNAGIGFTAYELDLFGRERSLSRSAFEQYLATAETRRSTQISLVAEVANAYLTRIADQALLRMTADTLQSQQQSLDLVQLKFNAGSASELDLAQAQSAQQTARANLAQYRRQLAQDDNALTLLLGATIPAALDSARELDQQALLAELPAGLPSELLTRRPDVLAAEHQLIAANADIGAARAAFLPNISLTANYGTASTELSGLFRGGSQAWTFMPTITLPIFAFGANKANLDLAKVRKNIQIAQYEKAIQVAFREVADALVARSTLDEQNDAQQAVLSAADRAYQLADLRYRNGVDSYLSVLDAQRTLYQAQQAAVSVQLARLQNQVTLYKALGGGWDEHTPTVDAASSSGSP